jgi:hypothetical protein
MQMNVFPRSYTQGAHLLRELQQLKPGDSFRMKIPDLLEIEVPASPLDRQTPEFIAKWMHARMPFYCTLHQDLAGGWWEIRRHAATREQ